MNMRRFLTPLLALLAAACATGQDPVQPRVIRKKTPEKEPVTQTLPLLKDPPAAVVAESGRLTFHVSPLSDKGLLTQQTHDALKALMQANHGAALVKLRAFVAGTGDMRRIQSIVSETFAEKKQPLPALTTIQVGALDLVGAQVAMEGVSVVEKDKKTPNPNGLALFSGQRAGNAAKALEQLQAAAQSARVAPEDMLRVTCFLSEIEQSRAARTAASRAFPAAAANFMQALRVATDSTAVCEGVGRRSNSDPVASGAAFAVVGASKLVLSGSQMAFRDQETDLHLAFDRLGKALESLGTGYKDVVYWNLYPLTPAIETKVRALQLQFVSPESGPAGTSLLFEGLPSIDSSVAIEVIAAVRD
jgi:enamine deaminase RidA (YjgF/YER057c/UK114 family)